MHYEDAIVELKRAVRRNPTSALAHEQLGVAYQAKGDEENALAQLNEAVHLAPGAASAHSFRGACTRARNDDIHAYQDAKVAFRLEANSQTRELLGKTALHANKCDEAIDVLGPLADSEETSPEICTCCRALINVPGKAKRAKKPREEYEERSKRVQGRQDAQDERRPSRD